MAKAPKFPGFSFAGAAVKVVAPKRRNPIVEHFVEGTADLAALKHLRELVDSAIENATGEFQKHATTFYLEGCGTGIKPESFTSTEHHHSCTAILGKRRSNSVLSDEEATLLDDKGIPYDTQDAEDTFSFNNAALADPKIRRRIENLLSQIDLPDSMTLIEKTPGAPKRTVTDETVASVFKLRANDAEPLLPIVTVFSVRSKWHMVAHDLSPLMERVGRLLNLPGMVAKLDRLTEQRNKKRRSTA